MTVVPAVKCFLLLFLAIPPPRDRRRCSEETVGGVRDRVVCGIGGDGGASSVGDGRSQRESGEQAASPGSDAKGKKKKRRKWNGYIEEATPVDRKRQMTADKKNRLTASLQTAGAWGWAASSDGGGRKRWSEWGRGKTGTGPGTRMWAAGCSGLALPSGRADRVDRLHRLDRLPRVPTEVCAD